MDQLIHGGLQVLGGLSAILTALHMFFPNVPVFQRFGMALRKFGGA